MWNYKQNKYIDDHLYDIEPKHFFGKSPSIKTLQNETRNDQQYQNLLIWLKTFIPAFFRRFIKQLHV